MLRVKNTCWLLQRRNRSVFLEKVIKLMQADWHIPSQDTSGPGLVRRNKHSLMLILNAHYLQVFLRKSSIKLKSSLVWDWLWLCVVTSKLVQVLWATVAIWWDFINFLSFNELFLKKPCLVLFVVACSDILQCLKCLCVQSVVHGVMLNDGNFEYWLIKHQPSGSTWAKFIPMLFSWGAKERMDYSDLFPRKKKDTFSPSSGIMLPVRWRVGWRSLKTCSEFEIQ